ncbi:MAG: FHA domain-containing protein [Pirellulales bacterium]|nr:FHA domain-containing protein [Pirellulales bacterium]
MLPDAILRLVNYSKAQWQFPIEAHVKVIGRCTEADVPIPDGFLGVSGRHAEVWRDQRNLYLRDLGSRGGTRVNGVPLPAQHPAIIVMGDSIALYDAELRVESRAINGGDGISLGLASNGDSHCEEELGDKEPGNYFWDARLTARELDIVMWMRRGLVDDIQLSRVLLRSPHTIRTQVGSILKKLRVHTRAAVVALPAFVAPAKELVGELGEH